MKAIAIRETREDRWANQINAAWQKTVEGILETGRLLIEAKAELARGEFTHMVREQLPFSTQTAQKLMAIARHPILSNPAHVRLLPTSWGTLAEIAKHEPEDVEVLLRNHRIKSDMTREQVSGLFRKKEKLVKKGLVQPTPVSNTNDNNRADRWERLEELAAAGNTSYQIAEILGVLQQTVAEKAIKLGITIHADRVAGRARRIDPNRILTKFAEGLEAFVPSCELIEPSKVDRHVLASSIKAIGVVMKALSELQKRLKRENENGS